eukprot:SAG31_NODE_3506_length_4187_cov_1.703767_7_plen_190_part_00
MNEERFAMMRDSADVINTARYVPADKGAHSLRTDTNVTASGPSVKESALIQALQTGKIAGCAMDGMHMSKHDQAQLLLIFICFLARCACARACHNYKTQRAVSHTVFEFEPLPVDSPLRMMDNVLVIFCLQNHTQVHSPVTIVLLFCSVSWIRRLSAAGAPQLKFKPDCPRERAVEYTAESDEGTRHSL